MSLTTCIITNRLWALTPYEVTGWLLGEHYNISRHLIVSAIHKYNLSTQLVRPIIESYYQKNIPQAHPTHDQSDID